MDFLKNIAINLKATGPAAVLIAWVLGVTCIAIFGNGPVAEKGMSALYISGGLLILTLGHRA
jgi:hypothetical protein